MKKLYVNVIGSEQRVAVEEDGRLVELFVNRPDEEELVGRIYYGRVVKVLPGMQAAFVDIGTDKHAYLRREDLPQYKEGISISQLVRQGEALLVQVVREAVDTKGPKVTAKIEFTGTYVVYLPFDSSSAVSKKIRNEEKRAALLQLGKGGGFVFRSACETAELAEIQVEMEQLQRTYQELQGKHKKVPALLYTTKTMLDRVFQEIPAETVSHIIVDDRTTARQLGERLGMERVTFYSGKEHLFASYGNEQELEKALKKIVWLDNGAYLLIEQTETMTVIDVNTGKFTGKQNLQDTVRKVNETAALEIVRQLRLRDIGGMILIDFINMKEERDKEAIRRLMVESLKKENTPARVFGFTALGILEVTRKRKRKSLRDLLKTSCTCCGGSGFVFSAETEAYRLQRDLLAYNGTDYEAVLVACHPHIQHVFQEQRLQAAVRVEVYFIAAQASYTIQHVGEKDEIAKRMK